MSSILDPALWVREFGPSYKPEPLILTLMEREGVIDASYRHDTSPHLERVTHDGRIAMLAFEHPDPEQREYEDATRYAVWFTDTEGQMQGEHDTLLTDDVEEAVTRFMKY